MYDFTPMIFTLPMWGSAVVNFKTEIHPTNTSGEVVLIMYKLSSVSFLASAI